MNHEEIVERVIDVVENFAIENADQITVNSELKKELGIDSLKMIEILLELEEEFGTQFNNGAVVLESFKSIATIVELVEAKQS